MDKVALFLRELGVLRALLWLATVAVIVCAPFADGNVHLGWRLATSVIVPTIAAMLAFALPLDMTMTRVFMLEAAEERRRRYRRIFRLEAALWVGMLAVWTPFMLRIIDP